MTKDDAAVVAPILAEIMRPEAAPQPERMIGLRTVVRRCGTCATWNQAVCGMGVCKGENTSSTFCCSSWSRASWIPALVVAIAMLASAPALAATPPADRCQADLRAAQANVAQAATVEREAFDIEESLIASQLTAAASEQLRTARAACRTTDPVELAAKATPFEADPFDASPVPAYVEPVAVPGIPYLVDPVVEATCPGADCPVVVVVAASVDVERAERW